MTSNRDKTRFSAVIVTHNSKGIVRPLLFSLPEDIEIVCVDNASGDGIEPAILPRPGIFVRNDRNLGYGAACNRGAEAAAGDYLIFMNPDVSFGAATFDAIRAATLRYPDAAAFSPRIVDEDGRVQNRDYNAVERNRSGRWRRRRHDFSGDCCVRFLHGGMFVIRRSVFEELGGFDPNIFLYYEDDDLAFRLTDRRLPIVYLHAAEVTHQEQASAPRSLRRRMRMNYHKKRSEIYVRRKYGVRYNRVVDVLDLASRVVFYAFTFNRRRLFGAVGRLRGALSKEIATEARG